MPTKNEACVPKFVRLCLLCRWFFSLISIKIFCVDNCFKDRRVLFSLHSSANLPSARWIIPSHSQVHTSSHLWHPSALVNYIRHAQNIEGHFWKLGFHFKVRFFSAIRRKRKPQHTKDLRLRMFCFYLFDFIQTVVQSSYSHFEPLQGVRRFSFVERVLRERTSNA